MPGVASGTWTIAQIAEELGITHRTVRYYEDLGLISPERRGTVRVFHPRDRIRLQLVLRGKRLGFPLEEIRTIVDMYDEQPGEAGQLRYLLGQIDDRRAELEQRKRDVEAALTELDDLERRCHDDLTALAEGGPASPTDAGTDADTDVR
ncbi:MAG: MerR family transcriptional regulator [Angustibacter sp.]